MKNQDQQQRIFMKLNQKEFYQEFKSWLAINEELKKGEQKKLEKDV